jgi:hypothetical protein
VSAFADLRQANDEIHMTGADWARPIGDVTVRAEVAHFLDRPTMRIARDLANKPLEQLVGRKEVNCLIDSVAAKGERPRVCRGPVRVDDLFVDRDAVEWGVGVDWLRSGVFMLGQLNQVIGTESAPRLIVSNPETRLTGLVRRRFLQDTLEVELRGIYSLERGGWVALPRVSYALTDQLRLRVGYLAIGGSKNSIFGQFGRNDEMAIQLRYSF